MWNNDILIDKTACLACNWESLIFQPRMWRKRFDILGLTTAESITNVASQKKIYNWHHNMKSLKCSNGRDYENG